MKQKLFFLALTLFVLGAASVQAQVTIGADATPHSAAVLDLQSNLGLKLPTVALEDVSVFQLLEAGDEEIETAVGLMVYNSSDATIGGNGKGIYVWEGKWVYAGKSAPADVPVTKIDITSDGYATELNASGTGSTLQLTATVEPDNASNKTLSWTQVYNPAITAGKVTVDESGLVTGVKAGDVTVRATATDGSTVYRNLALNVRPSNLVTGITIDVVNGGSSVEVGNSLQLRATVEPLSAYPTVRWSVDPANYIILDGTTGLVSGVSPGEVTITATALDGSDVEETYGLSVIPFSLPGTSSAEIGGITYQTRVYNGATWTIDNMTHGTSVASLYDNDPDRPNTYYNLTQTAAICDNGFVLPTNDDYDNLYKYLKGPLVAPQEISLWWGPSMLIGYRRSGGFFGWGTYAQFATASTDSQNYLSLDPGQKYSFGSTTNTNWLFGIRCVKYE
jgi:hypothetical protein